MKKWVHESFAFRTESVNRYFSSAVVLYKIHIEHFLTVILSFCLCENLKCIIHSRCMMSRVHIRESGKISSIGFKVNLKKQAKVIACWLL